MSSVLAWSPPAYSAAKYSSKYDDHIRGSAKRWLPLYPSWKRGKAQLIQESGLDPLAVSPVGAAGLGQFMPGTWNDVARHLDFDPAAPRSSAKEGIEAWAYYQGKLYQSWKSERPQEDRISLAEASYNAGIGNILKAQAKCGGASLWDQIMACLPDITGIHARETINYSTRIRRIWRDLELGG